MYFLSLNNKLPCFIQKLPNFNQKRWILIKNRWILIENSPILILKNNVSIESALKRNPISTSESKLLLDWHPILLLSESELSMIQFVTPNRLSYKLRYLLVFPGLNLLWVGVQSKRLNQYEWLCTLSMTNLWWTTKVKSHNMNVLKLKWLLHSVVGLD